MTKSRGVRAPYAKRRDQSELQLLLNAGSFQCVRCRATKPVAMFGRHKRKPFGLNDLCKSCRSVDDARQRYGLTSDNYAKLLEHQNGLCAICGLPESNKGRRLAIDHDHSTGVIRGLLCGACNKMIGLAYENPETLEAASDYIKRAKALGATALLPDGWS